QARGDLPRDRHRAGRLERAARQRLAQRRALLVVHHQVGDAGVRAVIDHAHQVRVGEPGHGARLALEAAPAQADPRRAAVQELDRDRPVEPDPHAAVDHAHAAGTDLALDGVASVEDEADPRVVHAGADQYTGPARFDTVGP